MWGEEVTAFFTQVLGFSWLVWHITLVSLCLKERVDEASRFEVRWQHSVGWAMKLFYPLFETSMFSKAPVFSFALFDYKADGSSTRKRRKASFLTRFSFKKQNVQLLLDVHQKRFLQKYILQLNHRIMEYFGLEGTLKPSQFLPWTGLPPTGSGCPGPQSVWPWMPPGMGHNVYLLLFSFFS